MDDLFKRNQQLLSQAEKANEDRKVDMGIFTDTIKRLYQLAGPRKNGPREMPAPLRSQFEGLRPEMRISDLVRPLTEVISQASSALEYAQSREVNPDELALQGKGVAALSNPALFLVFVCV